MLGNIIASRSGRELDEFAVAYLFNPLDMSSVRRLRSPLGVTNASSAIQSRPRDAATFGNLFLDGGRWNGVQVVPLAWVERAAEGVTAIHGESYGWLWWKSTFHVRGVGQEYNRASPSMIFFRDSILPTIHEAPAE